LKLFFFSQVEFQKFQVEKKFLIFFKGIAALIIYLSSSNNHILDSITSTLIELSDSENNVINMLNYGAIGALLALVIPPSVNKINHAVLSNVLRLLVTLSKIKQACDLIANHGNALPKITIKYLRKWPHCAYSPVNRYTR
jgi:hypothetical protein